MTDTSGAVVNNEDHVPGARARATIICRLHCLVRILDDVIDAVDEIFLEGKFLVSHASTQFLSRVSAKTA